MRLQPESLAQFVQHFWKPSPVRIIEEQRLTPIAPFCYEIPSSLSRYFQRPRHANLSLLISIECQMSGSDPIAHLKAGAELNAQCVVATLRALPQNPLAPFLLPP